MREPVSAELQKKLDPDGNYIGGILAIDRQKDTMEVCIGSDFVTEEIPSTCEFQDY